jgi:ATP-dependent Clp protease protease subunit
VNKFFNLVAGEQAGEKTLNIQVHGVIDGGWLDEDTSSAEIAAALAEHQDAKRIDVHINSVGGSLFGGVALYNLLQAHPAEVTSYVDGLAASAASLIAMAGKTVMGRGAMLMIHNPMAIAMGDAREMRRMAADLDKARDALLAIYKAKTGKDSTDLKSMLDAETFLTAEQAVRQGFADEIAGGHLQGIALVHELAVLAAVGDGMIGTPGIVAAVTGKRIRVISLRIKAAAASSAPVAYYWRSGVGGTAIDGGASNTIPLDKTGAAGSGGETLQEAKLGWFQTGVGEALVLNLSAAQAVTGSITYVEV